METLHLAQAYHVRMTQMDLDELGLDVDRERFKAYFGIPEDADEDPGYKRDPDFDLANLSRLEQRVVGLGEFVLGEGHWCGCKPSGPAEAYGPYQHPELVEHHYRCTQCRGILQIG